ncbi:MAG: DnaD domain protein [Ruminococcaceae bacterium]|nr:DnaD domain protein [Oscillospiraceae bacterium]
MKLIFNYGNSAFVLPGAVLDRIDRATKKDIKLILTLVSEPSLLSGTRKSIDEIIRLTGMKREEIEASISFWRGAGVLEELDTPTQEIETPKIKEVPVQSAEKPQKKLKSADSLPHYSTEELTSLLEKRAEYRFLIDECQQLFGKVLGTSEINMLIALTDYLGLDGEYILLLFAHCGKMEHKSVRTVEKLAHRFLDEGITDAETLGERLSFLEKAEETENKLRKLFGINSRAFTKKEKALLEKWLSEYKYDIDIIEKAYEVTIDSTQNPSLPYAGAIMDRWYSEGVRTPEDAEKNISEHKKNKGVDGGSFDTDEFLEVALKRSFEGK